MNKRPLADRMEALTQPTKPEPTGMNEEINELKRRLASLEVAMNYSALHNAGGEQAINSVIGQLLASAPATVQQAARAKLDEALTVLAQHYPAENLALVHQGFLRRACSLIDEYQPRQP